MKKYLITGFCGFVSQHFLEYLDALGVEAMVHGLDRNVPAFDLNKFKYLTCTHEQLDLLNKQQVDNVLYQFQPDYILHLASYSSVGFSWKNPVDSFVNNTNIFLNMIEQARVMDLDCRILSVGSSEEYGNVLPEQLPLHEDLPLKPLSPYAVARVSQEMLSKVYADGYGMDIIMTRSFNHIGPRQRDIFVIPSFAKQLVSMTLNSDLPRELITGDTTVVRDFVDVRDVVKAYHLLFEKGKRGECYNICSGKGVSLDEVIDHVASELNLDIERKVNPKFLRPNDNRVVIGSNERLKAQTGWEQSISLRESLKDIVDYWRENLKHV